MVVDFNDIDHFLGNSDFVQLGRAKNNWLFVLSELATEHIYMLTSDNISDNISVYIRLIIYAYVTVHTNEAGGEFLV